jgi:hypothetical protein
MRFYKSLLGKLGSEAWLCLNKARELAGIFDKGTA